MLITFQQLLLCDKEHGNDAAQRKADQRNIVSCYQTGDNDV